MRKFFRAFLGLAAVGYVAIVLFDGLSSYGDKKVVIKVLENVFPDVEFTNDFEVLESFDTGFLEGNRILVLETSEPAIVKECSNLDEARILTYPELPKALIGLFGDIVSRRFKQDTPICSLKASIPGATYKIELFLQDTILAGVWFNY